MSKKEFVIILIFTFIVFLTWVVSDLIRTPPSESIDNKLKKAAEPFDSSLDQATIKIIEQNEVIKTNLTPPTTPAVTDPIVSSDSATVSAETR